MRKGSCHSEKAKLKMSIALKRAYTEGRKIPCSNRGFQGHQHSEDAKQKNKLAHLGKEPWNKGLRFPGLVNSSSFKLGRLPWNKGIPLSGETKRKLSQKIAPRTKRWWTNPNNKEAIKARNKAVAIGVKMAWVEGKYDNEQWRTNQSESQKESWANDPDRAEKCLQFRKPNSKEIILDNLLAQNFPGQWEYVGNGSAKIGRKVPDWISTDGKRGVIELFGERWHNITEESQLIQYYNEHGYCCLVIWVAELNNPQTVIEKVRKWQY